MGTGHREHRSRRLLREWQGISEAEVDSLLRLVESRLEVSFLRLLGSGTE
jgi:hypothetical protein